MVGYSGTVGGTVVVTAVITAVITGVDVDDMIIKPMPTTVGGIIDSNWGNRSGCWLIVWGIARWGWWEWPHPLSVKERCIGMV